MSKLYACIISEDIKSDGEALARIAHEFAYSIERLEDGILFDVSGLQRLMGGEAQISQKILGKLKEYNVSGKTAVADRVETATLLARQSRGARSHRRRSRKLSKTSLARPAYRYRHAEYFQRPGDKKGRGPAPNIQRTSLSGATGSSLPV